jgi:2-phosphosulfolactate phosphatase
MNIRYTDLKTCHDATGMVVAIDVIRAFSNAAFAFSKGAREIYPLREVKDALVFKQNHPGALACGEVGGLPPKGFDFGNSPTQTRELDLNDKVIVQRTGAGTQGVVRSVKADAMAAASFVVANATVKYILNNGWKDITFVITGIHSEDSGDEDLACAQYMEQLLIGNTPDPQPYLQRVRSARESLEMLRDERFAAVIRSDLVLCSSLDMFDFAMPVVKENGMFVMRKAIP